MRSHVIAVAVNTALLFTVFALERYHVLASAIVVLMWLIVCAQVVDVIKAVRR